MTRKKLDFGKTNALKRSNSFNRNYAPLISGENDVGEFKRISLLALKDKAATKGVERTDMMNLKLKKQMRRKESLTQVDDEDSKSEFNQSIKSLSFGN